MADAMCGGYYSTEPNPAGGGGYWTASIELNGDFVVAEVYGDTADEVRERCAAFLSGIAASPPARKEAPAEGAGGAWKPLYDRHGYLNDPEGLARIRSGLLEVKDWHDLPGAIVNCNSLARLLDTIDALRNRTSEPEAGAVAGFLGHLVTLKDGDAVFIPKGERIPLISQGGSVTPIYDGPQNVTAPATADKLKLAKEALREADAAARSGAAMCAADYRVDPEKLGEAIYTITTPALAALTEEGN